MYIRSGGIRSRKRTWKTRGHTFEYKPKPLRSGGARREKNGRAPLDRVARRVLQFDFIRRRGASTNCLVNTLHPA